MFYPAIIVVGLISAYLTIKGNKDFYANLTVMLIKNIDIEYENEKIYK